MRNRRKIVSLSLLLVPILFLSSCSNSRQLAASEKRKNIEFIVKMRSSEYWNSVYAGAHEATKDLDVNMNFVAPDYENDVEQQEKLMLEAINRKVDAIVLASSDYTKMKAVVEKAWDNKIPVVIVDSSVDTNKISSSITTDNVEAGKMAGEKLVTAMGTSGNVAIINFVKGTDTAGKREEGVRQALLKYPDIKVVDTEYCYSNEKLAVNLTKNIISLNNRIGGIVALNSVAAIGAAQALDELGLSGKIKLVGFDATVQEIQYIERNVIETTVVQNPYAMGYLGLRYAALLADGIKVPSKVNIDSRIIDKANMYTKENQKFIFPFVK